MKVMYFKPKHTNTHDRLENTIPLMRNTPVESVLILSQFGIGRR